MNKKFKEILNKRIEETEKIIESEVQFSPLQKQLLITNWLSSIILMECLTKKHFIRYNITNLTVIIGGILIPVIINLDIKFNDIENLSKYIVTFLGVMVSICATINQSYKFNERWKHFRNIAEQLKIEGEKFFSLSGIYHEYTSLSDAFSSFMFKITTIKEGQIKSYMRVVKENENKKNQEDKEDVN